MVSSTPPTDQSAVGDGPTHGPDGSASPDTTLRRLLNHVLLVHSNENLNRKMKKETLTMFLFQKVD